MIYREAGQFKTSYGADQAMLPIAQDRWVVGAAVAVMALVVPFISNEYMLQAILIPFLILSLAAIGCYIWFRFEWQFGVGAVIALMHDVILTIGVFSILGLEFNLSTVAAVLTIAGYSINDTVVIYDRVRENLRKYKTLPLDDLLNLSVNDTLSRTILTSVTTLLALLCLFFFGGQVIKGFSFAMIWGVIVGTYSSIWVAVPLLVYMKLKRGGLIVGEVDDDQPAGG